MAILLYGAGRRFLECARLRVKDVDFAANQIGARAGKGDRDGVTMLAGAVKADLARHLELVKRQHEREDGRDIRTVQELLGHRDLSTTMILHARAQPGPGRRAEPCRPDAGPMIVERGLRRIMETRLGGYHRSA